MSWKSLRLHGLDLRNSYILYLYWVELIEILSILSDALATYTS